MGSLFQRLRAITEKVLSAICEKWEWKKNEGERVNVFWLAKRCRIKWACRRGAFKFLTGNKKDFKVSTRFVESQWRSRRIKITSKFFFNDIEDK